MTVAKDLIQWKNNFLALHRTFDKADAYTSAKSDWLQAAVRFLPDGKRHSRGQCMEREIEIRVW